MSVVTRGTCPDPELLTALVDGEVDGVTRAELTLHAGTCAECTAILAAERRAKAAVSGLGAPVPSSDLSARLLAIPASEGQTEAPVLAARRRRMPTYLAAAASVVVLMVGAFTFLGAVTDSTNPRPPSRTTAIVPAADRLAQEHMVTSASGLGGPVAAAVPASLPVEPTTADQR